MGFACSFLKLTGRGLHDPDPKCMVLSALKRGRDGKLRYTRDGRAYAVRAEGARYYTGGGSGSERVYCTRDVRRFLREEAARGARGGAGGAGNAGPAQSPVAGQSAIELLPMDPTRNVMRRLEDPADLAAFLMTSPAMTTHAGRREWAIIAKLPTIEFRKIVRRLGERECLGLNEALGEIMAANPVGAQHPDEDVADAAMNAWVDASNKMDIVAARLAVIQAAAGAPGAPA